MNKKNIAKLKFFLFIAIIAVAILFLICNWKAIKHINLKKLETSLRQDSFLAILIFVFLFLIKPIFVIIPANIIAILTGAVFGPVKGFLFSIMGFFISGTVAFYISRYLGKDFVEGILGQKFLKLDNDLEEKGFKILLLLRLPPILPFDPLSYGCGLSKIAYRDFILASLLGVMPETLCYSIMGKNFNNPFSPTFIIAITVVIVATIFSKRIISAKEKYN